MNVVSVQSCSFLQNSVSKILTSLPEVFANNHIIVNPTCITMPMYMLWSLISFILYNDFVKVLTFKDFISFLFQKILQDISKILKIFFLKSIPSWHAYCIVNKSLNAIITTGFYHCNGSFQKLFWIEAIFILHKKYDEDSICDLMGAQYICHVQGYIRAFKVI